MENKKIENLIVRTFASEKIITPKKRRELIDYAATIGVDRLEFQNIYRKTLKTLQNSKEIRQCPKCNSYILSKYSKCLECGFDIEEASPLDSLKVFVANNSDNKIKSCALPETREELIEFLNFLNISIDTSGGTVYVQGKSTCNLPTNLVNKACIDKMLEVFQRIQILFPEDAQLNKIMEKSNKIIKKACWDNIDACPLPLTEEDLMDHFSFFFSKIEIGSTKNIQNYYRDCLLVCIKKAEILFPENMQLGNMVQKGKEILKQHKKKRITKKIIITAIPVVIILLIIILCKSCS